MLITRLKSVLIFAILAAVFSCADPYESSEVVLENSRRAVQPEDIPHVTSKLFNRLGLANGTERFSMASATGDSEFTIDWEKILESIDSSGTATYTFYLHSNATRPGEFYNMVMRLDSENNAYKPFIVRYTMTDKFLQQYLATGSMEGFDGEMSIIPVKGPDSGTEYQASLPDHVRSIIPDKHCPEENIGFDGGSSGGGGGGPSTGGSTGGGGSWVTVTRCDYYLVKNYYETYVDGEYSSTNYYYTMEKDCYEYSYLSHTEVAGEDDCDLGDGEIPIIDLDVDCKELRNDHGEPDNTIWTFYNANRNISYNEILKQRPDQSLMHLNSQPGGPNIRYIKDPLSKTQFIDLRHMLIIGKKGRLVGNGVEAAQWISDNPSAYDDQDFYSNELGYAFFKEYGEAIEFNPTGLADYLVTFLYDKKKRNALTNPNTCDF